VVAVVEKPPIHRLVFSVLHHFPSFLVCDEIVINDLHVLSTPDISRDSRLLVTFPLSCIVSTVMECNEEEETF
jgi:hypothetical protein